MDVNQELLDLVTKLSKKVDKLSNTVNKIAKTLHLLPVTEKEEREIQILQRTNMKLAAKVNDDLNAMSSDTPKENGSIFSIYEAPQDIFGDVVADDLLGGFTSE